MLFCSPPDKLTEEVHWAGDEFEAEGGGGGVLQAGQFLALQPCFLLPEDFRVEGFPVFEAVPEDARASTAALVQRAAARSLAPACKPA